MSPRFEAFLARLYVDDALRARFLADPAAEATRAQLSPEEHAAALAIDRDGLALFASSLAHKRAHACPAPSAWQRLRRWLRR